MRLFQTQSTSRSLIFLAISTLSSFALAQNTESSHITSLRAEAPLYREILAAADLTSTSLPYRLFSSYIDQRLTPLEQGKKLNPYEVIVLRQYPTLGFVLKNISCKAHLLSLTLCDIDLTSPNAANEVNDEEADAIRHFVFSSLISASRSKGIATLFTTAHEGAPEQWTDRSLMDLHNNQVGIASGDRTREMEFTDVRIAKAALRALQSGRLATLFHGASRCADPSIFSRDIDELLAKKEKNLARLREVLVFCQDQ